MPTQQHINTYGGLNQDTAFDSIQPNMYIDALDVRISTSDGESNGAITNIEGNSESFSIDQTGATGTKEIIGHCVLRNYIILFCADDTGTNGWIYYISYDEKSREINTPIVVPNAAGDPVLVYFNAGLNFKKANPIEAVGRFENTTAQRIYWTDYFEPLRSLNIAAVLNGGAALTIDLGLIDIFPLVDYIQPIITNIGGGGNLLVGEYQFAYRLTTFDGKQTLISPPGVLTHITNNNENTPRTAEYMGDPKDTTTNKSIEVTIDTSNYKTKYEKIELISLFYNIYEGTPEISSVEELIIGATDDTIVFNYTGFEATITIITTIEFAIKVYPFKTVKTLVPKDNSLVVANIKETRFSIQELLIGVETFDANVVRYNSAGTPPIAGVTRKFNTEYNSDAHWDVSWHTTKQFKYKSNGTTLGGESPNIQFNFKLKKFELNGNNPSKAFANLNNSGPQSDTNLADGYSHPNKTFTSFASPYLSGLTKGYKRGDTYRFGIVFYNLKGEASFVEYIGDIKFPDISEIDGAANASGTNYWPIATPNGTGFRSACFGYDLGIEVTVDFTSCPSLLTQLSRYQIVRVKRENKDKKRICSGLVKNFHQPRLGSAGGNYNFQDTTGGENIVHLGAWDVGKIGQGSGIPANNGSFTYLSDQKNFDFEGPGVNQFNNSTNPLKDSHNPIREHNLAFYSPEVSYNFESPFSSGINGDNAALLITGSWKSDGVINGSGLNYDTTNSLTAGYVGSPMGNNSTLLDNRANVNNTVPIDLSNYGRYAPAGVPEVLGARGIEYIKKITNSTKASFVVNDDYLIDGPNGDGNESVFTLSASTVLDNSSILYYRNVLADYGVNQGGTPNNSLNKPNDSTVDDAAVIIAQGGTSLFAELDVFKNDPITTTAIPNVEQSTPVGFSVWRQGSGGAPGEINAFSTLGAGTGAEPNYPHYWSRKNLGLSEQTWDYVRPLSGDSRTDMPIVDYYVPRAEIYGGLSDGALETNAFVPCSPVIDMVPSKTFEVFGGDMFISMWTFQWCNNIRDDIYFPNTGSDKYANNGTFTQIIPIETNINIDLAYGSDLKRGVKYFWGADPLNNIKTQYRREEENLSGQTNGKVLNMYKNAYNTVYSINQTESGLGFFIKPSTITESGLINDIRGYLSDVKINGEFLDSWTIFRSNNYYDVESDHGSINKIVNWRDEVYFFQDNGVGAYSINPRAVTTTADGIPTELGSGQGFAHHQYITTENGSIHQWGVKTTDTGIYYYDATHSKIFRIGEGNSPLSEIKGMHSFLNIMNGDILLRKENGGDNPILGKGITMARDMINDEVLFSFHGRFTLRLVDNRVFTYYPGEYVYYVVGPDTFYFIVNTQFTTQASFPANQIKVTNNCTQITNVEFITQLTTRNNTTLVFDELAQSFSSLYSAVPPTYLENGNILLSPNPSSKANVFIHNKGNFGEFYGTVSESYVKLVINPNADINKILRFLEFNSTVRDKTKTIDRTKTITAFRVQTQYQDTNKVAYSAANVKRRFDKWRLKIPRDQLSTSKRGRLRSTFFTLTLYYDNTYNKELILNRIMSHYDIQVY